MKKFHEIDLSQEQIGSGMYYELKYFCLAYPEKVKRLKELSQFPDRRAEAEKLQKDITAVENAVKMAVSGQEGLIEPLLRNLTRNESIDKMPCGKNQAYKYRKLAFIILNKIK